VKKAWKLIEIFLWWFLAATIGTRILLWMATR